MKVLFDNVIVRILEDDSNRVIYRTDPESLKTRRCVVLGAGPGYFNEKTRDYDGMPVKMGDIIICMNNQFLQMDGEDKDKELAIKLTTIIKVVGFDKSVGEVSND